MTKFLKEWRGALILLGTLFVGWQALYMATGDIAMRSPLQTLRFTAAFLANERYWPDLAETALACTMAVAISIGVGLTTGLVLGAGKVAGQIFEPMLVTVYSIPKLTLYPILLLLFGLGMSAKVAFGAIHGIIPIALFTLNAVRNIKPVLIKSGRVLQYGPADMATKVLIPAALPEIVTGGRIGFSLTLIGTLYGEMFASQRGLGNLLMRAIGLHQVDIIMAIALIVTVVAALGSSLLLALDRRLHARA
ncbi:MAG: ABC transporter permease subunit [Alphaproteobacteria bacterium]|nr:ABC transporter permease subunit [Alphaproteobacteria bacterium]